MDDSGSGVTSISLGEVREELDKVLSSKGFAQSERMRRFLTFAVEETLAGRSDEIKEFAIAVQVFDRDESYDSRESTIVRSEARRLRARLDEYYAGEGREDRVRIDVPKGGYAAAFSEGPKRNRLGRQVWRKLGLAVSALVLLAAGYSGWNWIRAPQAPVAIAVLPLVNLSGDAEQEYFADGLTELLITDLARLSGLRVTSRTTVMQYKEAGKMIPQIARELGVSHLVEGSVQRAGDRVRITIQVVDAARDDHVWAESYERNLDDILSLQREIARAVAREVRIQLTPDDENLLATRPAVGREAYEAYLRGYYHWDRLRQPDLFKARDYFEEAIAKAPDWEQPWAGLSDTYRMIALTGWEPPKDAGPKAVAASKRAIELAPRWAGAHRCRACDAAILEWDWELAEREIAVFRRLDPDQFWSHLAYGWCYLAPMGRLEEAQRELERAVELAPLHMPANTFLGLILAYRRDYAGAHAWVAKTLALEPDYASGTEILASLHAMEGRYEEALRIYGQASLPCTLAWVEALRGNHNEARRLLRELEANPPSENFGAHHFAKVYVALGEHETALDYLERSYTEKDPLVAYLAVDTRFDDLRGNPRFEKLLANVGIGSPVPESTSTE